MTRSKAGQLLFMGKLRVNSSQLALAPHIGFPSPAAPLFRDLLGSIDPLEHVRFAAEQRFSGIQDPFSASRSPTEQEAIGAAADMLGLSIGCFVYTTIQRVGVSMWGDPHSDADLYRDLEEAMGIGRRLGGRHIAVLSATAPHLQREVQFVNMAERLRRAADHVAKSGFTLCVEAVSAHRLPHLLLHHIRDAYDVVCNANHAAVRLIFDTAHVQAMDGDVGAALERVWDKV
jgi:hydroxypyruvate isomerase